MNLNDLPDMSEALRQVYEKKKLDPVGKEDGDIDNDGDKDSSDSYLLNRRKTVTKAMGKKTHLCAKMVKKEGKTYETIPEQHTMLEDGTVTHYDITDGKTILENVPVEDLEIVIAEAHEHFDNHDKNAEVLGEGGLYANIHAKRKRGEKMRKKGEEGAPSEQDFKDAAKTAKEEFASEGVRDEDPEKGTAERKARLEKKRGMKLDDHPQYKKEETEEVEEGLKQARKNVGADTCWDGYVAKGTKKKNGRDVPNCVKKEDLIALSDEELELIGEEIDALTDEELVDFMEEIILEMVEEGDDLEELVEHIIEDEFEFVLVEDLEKRKIIGLKSKLAGSKADDRKASAAKQRAEIKSRKGRMGAAAKTAGGRLKSAVKKVAQAAGKVAGEFSAAKAKQKSKAMSRKDDAPKKDAPKKASGVTSPVSDKGRASGGGERDAGAEARERLKSRSSDSGSTRKAVGGALKKVGSVVKKGLKKVVGKTARVVSKGSDKLAKRLGENYDEIAHLYESGLFTLEEIENVMELYKGKHGQSEKQYQDGRSDAGKMISGDSKTSGAAYSARGVKNTGPNPAGGSERPKAQGRMGSKDRAYLAYRKANMKKKD